MLAAVIFLEKIRHDFHSRIAGVVQTGQPERRIQGLGERVAVVVLEAADFVRAIVAPADLGKQIPRSRAGSIKGGFPNPVARDHRP